MNRRKFCLSSVAATFSGAAAGWAGAPAAGQTGEVTQASSALSARLHIFIYDRRYSAGRTFGAAAEHVRTSAGIVAIGGDITALWSRDLRPRWSAGCGRIAGMTSARTLFCLEQLAKDHWMRVVIRAEHAISEGHDFVHRVTATEPWIARMASVLVAEDWPTKLPAVLATWQGPDGSPRITRMVGSVCQHRSVMTDKQLVSFVIA